MRRTVLSTFVCLSLCVAASFAAHAKPSYVRLWHSYRGDEERALSVIVAKWNKDHPELQVELLNIPFGAFAQKLASAIPHDNGPDIFIAAHERTGDYVRNNLIVPIPDATLINNMPKRYVQAFKYEHRYYGVPLAYKSLALFYNKRLVDAPPRTLSELVERAKALTDHKKRQYGLAFEAASPYYALPFLFGFGGGIFDETGTPNLATKANARAIGFLASLVRDYRIVPEEATAALVTQLFNSGKAAFVINGPWFLGEISSKVDFGVAPLPIVDKTGKPLAPALTVEGIFFAARAQNLEGAVRFVAFLVSEAGIRTRVLVGHQNAVGAENLHFENESPKYANARRAFMSQARVAVPLPSRKEMRLVWEPLARALRRVLRGAAEPMESLRKAQTELAALLKPPPEPADPVPYLALMLVLVGAALWWLFKLGRDTELRQRIRRSRVAYLYLLPTALAMLVLMIIPFVVGSAISLFAHVEGEFTFVGLKNFWRILSCADYSLTDPLSFYFTLGVTVLWTVLNVALHVTIGVMLALLLRPQWLRLKSVYRVLLIVPWAVPNYITALIWKGMFNKQMGAINALLSIFGVEPISWFSKFSTAFAANLATNTWLGFPFMMVVTLGALQSIPRELEEAAMVDGANAWQRFWHVVLPLLKPALLPAVILGSVWTFNMFNIIYLVSGGEPDGATEILISEAYKWAFERNEQYGYAAAYAVLIFIVLVLFNALNQRVLRSREV